MPDGSDDEGENHGGSQLRVYAGLAHAADPVVGGRFPSVAEGLAYKYLFTREPYPVVMTFCIKRDRSPYRDTSCRMLVRRYVFARVCLRVFVMLTSGRRMPM